MPNCWSCALAAASRHKLSMYCMHFDSTFFMYIRWVVRFVSLVKIKTNRDKGEKIWITTLYTPKHRNEIIRHDTDFIIGNLYGFMLFSTVCVSNICTCYIRVLYTFMSCALECPSGEYFPVFSKWEIFHVIYALPFTYTVDEKK